MKPLLLCWLWLCAFVHADWQQELTRKPGKFPPLREVKGQYEFGLGPLTVAEAELSFSSTKSLNRLDVTAKTVGTARKLWRFDSTTVCTCSKSTFRPVRIDQVETDAKRKLTTTVNFNPKGVTRLKVAEPPDKNPSKPKTFEFTPVYDLFSALLFSRSQALTDGQHIQLCVYPGSDAYVTEITVEKRETLKIGKKEYPAIRCDVQVKSLDKELNATPHKKLKKATAWLSDDADRIFLRVEAEVSVGKVWGVLKAPPQ